MVILLLTSTLLFLFQSFLQFLNLLSLFAWDVLVFIVQDIWCCLLHRQFSSHSTTVAFVVILEEHRPVWVRPVPCEVRFFSLVRIDCTSANRRLVRCFWLWPVDVRGATAQKQPIIWSFLSGWRQLGRIAFGSSTFPLGRVSDSLSR